MLRTHICTALIVGLALASGCVPQEEVDRRDKVARTLEEQVFKLREDLDNANNAIASQRSQIRQRDDTVSSLTRENAALQRQLRGAVQDLENFGEQLEGIGGGLISPQLQAALENLAAEQPDVFAYDARAGMIRLGSDVTFASGSTELTPQAASVLAQLATILRQYEDAPFEVWVVGYTDSQPIGRSRDRFPTNMHLSVYRAIAVRDLLVSEGLPTARVGVGGWGEFRPIAPATLQGELANRRVEIYLRADTSGSALPFTPPAADTSAPSTVQQGPGDDVPMK